MATKCPDCGTFNPNQADFCKKCGADLNPKHLVVEPTAKKKPWYKRLFGGK